MLRIIFMISISMLSVAAFAETPVGIDDRLYDMKAQIASLKTEVEAAKSLAEQESPSAFNPSISVVGDVLGHYAIKAGHAEEHNDNAHGHAHHMHNGVFLREVEFEFLADVDPFADAVIALGVAPHGIHHVDLHLEEAYVRLKQLPIIGVAPLGLTTKIGRFRTAIGRMGRTHLHNIPQITYPLAMRSFLGEEGYSSQGLSFSFSVNPGAKTVLNFFLEGVFLNRLPMQEKGAEKTPTGISHVWWYQELKDFHYLDVGMSALLARKNKKTSDPFWLFGGDVHYSYIPAGYGQDAVFLLGNELFTANHNEGKGRWPIGNFTWAQIRLWESSFLGVRYDLAPKEGHLSEFQDAASIYLTHYTSEFLRFRGGYEYARPTMDSFLGDHRLMLSMIFILGSHPAEPYFVNR